MDNSIQILWKTYSPYIHIIGWAIVVVFLAGMFWRQNQEIPAKIEDLSQRIATVETKQTETNVDFATVKQEVHDMHEYLIPKQSAMLPKWQDK